MFDTHYTLFSKINMQEGEKVDQLEELYRFWKKSNCPSSI